MKNLIVASFLAITGLGHSVADEIVVPYESFGPQVLAHELIGMAWWQWDSHGDSRPKKYPIQVVVYWGQALEQTEQRYPSQREKEKDFRYVERGEAIEYLVSTLKELKKQPEYFTSELVKLLSETLTQITATERNTKKSDEGSPVRVHIHD